MVRAVSLHPPFREAAEAWLAEDPDPKTAAELSALIERADKRRRRRATASCASRSPASSSSAPPACAASSAPARSA